MTRKLTALLAVVALNCLLWPLAAQQAGGSFIPSFAYRIAAQWTWGALASPFVFEGATDDDSETTFTITDPTADRTWTFPDASDTVVGRATTDTLTNKTVNSAILNLPNFASESVTAAGGTETLTSADCGQTTLLDTDSGSVITLPAATGSGCVFRFFVTDGVGSNNHQIKVVGNDEFVGGLISIGTTADQTDAFTAAEGADTDQITMNGSTTGGLEGTWIIIQDVSADNWALSGIVVSTDASATMLQTAQVS